MDNKLEFTTIDEYITQAPPETKEVLQKIRETIKAAAPEATEKISYQMPTFYLEGNLVHFAVAKNHYGFIQPLVVLRHSNLNSEITSIQKVLYSFQSKKKFLMN